MIWGLTANTTTAGSKPLSRLPASVTNSGAGSLWTSFGAPSSGSTTRMSAGSYPPSIQPLSSAAPILPQPTSSSRPPEPADLDREAATAHASPMGSSSEAAIASTGSLPPQMTNWKAVW